MAGSDNKTNQEWWIKSLKPVSGLSEQKNLRVAKPRVGSAGQTDHEWVSKLLIHHSWRVLFISHTFITPQISNKHHEKISGNSHHKDMTSTVTSSTMLRLAGLSWLRHLNIIPMASQPALAFLMTSLLMSCRHDGNFLSSFHDICCLFVVL